ncbi:molybdopterin-dependent oxidoreductase [Shewanella olleyana]|uniref:DMSO/selenate family reductase complex A subunit n=1 Tax=Shewanella olleyana TaxID=135626 RepID=UPI00200C07D4|nr:DMSO/selenate family reductase complex A subunit [Shewanella olleyana]MCL1067385.1 molybdopterin-dependent oxidoreductase [Shewanella olleyana]
MERRSFLKASAALGCAATVTGCNSSSKDAEPLPPQPPVEEKMTWSACLSNCGSNCPLKVFSVDGKIVRIETDDEGDDSFGNHQVRACARGRSNRKRVYNPDRIQYPMKRIGKRGEGKFERISWEQATSEIGAQLKGIYDSYGPRSVYYMYGTGAYYDINGANSWKHMLNVMGGYLGYYGTYSSAQSSRIFDLVYGSGARSTVSELQHSDLCLFFGYNPLEIRQSGSGEGYEYAHYKEKHNIKSVIVDCRYSDTVAGKDTEYHACRPGTDAALCAGIAHHLITEGLIDETFLSEKVYGFRDEPAMPEKGLDALPYERSYEAYILGTGELDSQAKTPEWAESICGVSASNIRSIAEQLAAAKAPYIVSGYGLQRQANGENNAWAVAALCMLVGAIGKRGTTTSHMSNSAFALYTLGLPVLTLTSNAEKAKISVFSWPDAIRNGKEMTAFKDGVQLPDHDDTNPVDGKLDADIKAIINVASNTLINQHSDCFSTAELLEDDTLCELIVVSENHMTASAKFADYLLPDTTWLETDDIANQCYSAGAMSVITPLTKAVEPLFESRCAYEVCADIADAMGVGAEYSQGRADLEATLEDYYQGTVSWMDPQFPPTYKEFQQKGIVKKFAESSVSDCAFYDELNTPGYEFETPSGKIELFSNKVDLMSKNWEKPDYVLDPTEVPNGHHITPIPAYIVTWEGYEDPNTRDEYPLQLIGHHTKGRVHSSYHSVQWLREAVHDAIWVNPDDASGFSDGDWVIVEGPARDGNPSRRLKVQARVSDRIMPGVASIPQGAWFEPEGDIDVGGCVNTLTAYRPSPIAKANPQHTNRIKIYKA